MIFFIFIMVVIVQRITELVIAKRNEKWMKDRGGIEYGKKHYRFMVGIHILFFLCLVLEVLVGAKRLSPYWPLLVAIFSLTQLGRIWALSSLGRYWNTKIIVVPDANVIQKGPYCYIKHPNYLIVTIEFIVIPLMFHAFGTMVSFSMLNILILMIRIPIEEQALTMNTNYSSNFQGYKRFLPFVKKI